jgi:hypothetical protein
MKYPMIKHFALSFLCFCLLVGPAYGQKNRSKKIFHFEAKSARFNGEGVGGETYFFKPTFEAGFGMHYPLTSRVSFNPMLTLSQKGFHGKTNYSDSTYTERNLSLNYLDISPNFEIKLGSVSEYASGFSVWGAPYLGIGLWDNATYDIRSANPAKPGSYLLRSTTGESFSRDIRRLDMGFKIGLGVVSQNFVSLGITYQAGVINIATESKALYNQSLGFYMRVLFDDIL